MCAHCERDGCSCYGCNEVRSHAVPPAIVGFFRGPSSPKSPARAFVEILLFQFGDGRTAVLRRTGRNHGSSKSYRMESILSPPTARPKVSSDPACAQFNEWQRGGFSRHALQPCESRRNDEYPAACPAALSAVSLSRRRRRPEQANGFNRSPRSASLTGPRSWMRSVCL